MRNKADEIAEFLYDTRSQLYDIRLEALLKRWPNSDEEDFAEAFKIYAKRKLDDQLDSMNDFNSLMIEKQDQGLEEDLLGLQRIWNEYWRLRDKYTTKQSCPPPASRKS
jgi:hypothetical protein